MGVRMNTVRLFEIFDRLSEYRLKGNAGFGKFPPCFRRSGGFWNAEYHQFLPSAAVRSHRGDRVGCEVPRRHPCASGRSSGDPQERGAADRAIPSSGRAHSSRPYGYDRRRLFVFSLNIQRRGKSASGCGDENAPPERRSPPPQKKPAAARRQAAGAAPKPRRIEADAGKSAPVPKPASFRSESTLEGTLNRSGHMGWPRQIIRCSAGHKLQRILMAPAPSSSP